MLSGVVEASVDVRKACNGIKRTAALGAAALVCGLKPDEAANAAEQMAMAVLEGIGFDVRDEVRVAAVLPMMLDATTAVIAHAAYHAKDAGLGAGELAKAATGGVAALSAIAKSRSVAKMVEPAYPVDMDEIIALRLTAASAMAHVAVEATSFDFMHTAEDCIKEASKVVIKAAMDASKTLAPAQSSPSAKLMLSQSLMQSAAKVYAAAWRAYAAEETARLDALSDADCELELQGLEASTMAELLAPITSRFSEAFRAVTASAMELFSTAESERAEQRRPEPTRAARPR
jgi:hypothetical protein